MAKKIFTDTEYVANKVKEEENARVQADQAAEDKINGLSDKVTNKADLSKTVCTKHTGGTGYDSKKIYTWVESGIYLTDASGIEDLPPNWAQGRYCVTTFSNGNPDYSYQMITPYQGGAGTNKKIAFRNTIKEGSEWRELITAENIDLQSYFKNGWVNYNPEGSGLKKATAIKNGNTVKLSGVIKGGDLSSALMVLPQELRPRNATIVYVQYADKSYRVDVNVSGNVIPNTPLPSNSYLSLESISYMLD